MTGSNWSAYGEGSTQAAAEAVALAALNGQRGIKYGKGASAYKDGQGNTLTADLH